jgi:hypothetical protein
VKRLSADDSADPCVKVGLRQAPHKKPPDTTVSGGFVLHKKFCCKNMKFFCCHLFTISLR